MYTKQPNNQTHINTNYLIYLSIFNLYVLSRFYYSCFTVGCILPIVRMALRKMRFLLFFFSFIYLSLSKATEQYYNKEYTRHLGPSREDRVEPVQGLGSSASPLGFSPICIKCSALPKRSSTTISQVCLCVHTCI